jgi:DNA invertase Pin-like site-specific DNA recombinase
MKTKVFSYLRVSGLGQVKGDGFTRQREAITKFCRKNRYQIVSEFKDSGVSGTVDGFDRAGLSELMVAVKSNGVKTIIVENSTRLARDLMVQEVLLNDCRKCGITVLSADGNILTDENEQDPTRTLIRQVLGAVSQFEKSCIVQKLASARKRIKKAKGRCEGDLPYGYKEGEDILIQRIREMKKEKRRISQLEICRKLTEEGFRTRKGTAFSQPQISRILKRV